MSLFQQHLLTVIARHPGITRDEIALALGLEYLSNNRSRYLRHLEDRGIVISKRVKMQGKTFVKIYRVKS